ncbi:hypothetical protein KKF81_02075 [Candidatus Micrarchaeota archaeon]|nr:hypothetical protein [Candidatus Micrarchaeota archaeon]MBU1165708.1 hypothetical protein [Candidatus Micrarchaeota archaeon]MBU1887075.1 hypothetical protein [Candidatus Micrarchaeota archaeon]
MRLMLFFKLVILSLCASLLFFALAPESTLVDTLKLMAFGTVSSIAVTAFYPDIRGIKLGDKVSVVNSSSTPGILGRLGKAMAHCKKNDRVKIVLDNGGEILGIVESYSGLISPPKIRAIYEERLVD